MLAAKFSFTSTGSDRFTYAKLKHLLHSGMDLVVEVNEFESVSMQYLKVSTSSKKSFGVFVPFTL